jgi:hypothetical protein
MAHRSGPLMRRNREGWGVRPQLKKRLLDAIPRAAAWSPSVLMRAFELDGPASSIGLAEQTGQAGYVYSNPASLVFGEHLGLHRLGFGLPGINVRERLPVGIADDVAAGHPVSAPGRRKSAGHRGLRSWRFESPRPR